MKANFTNVEKKNFDPIPAGTYVAVVTDGEQTETKNAGKLPQGTPGVHWEFTIKGGQYDGRKVWTNTWIAETTMFSLLGLLEATGEYSEEQLSGELDFEIEDVIGSELKLKVSVRAATQEYDATNDVKRFYPLSDADQVAAASELP